jgi:hypothetical protein
MTRGTNIWAVLALVFVGLLVIGICPEVITEILPFGRADEIAYRTVCGTNMVAIERAINLYAAEHDDRTPPDFQALLEGKYVDRGSLICPSSGSTPADPNRLPKLPPVSDCVYVPGFRDGWPITLVQVFELPANHRQDCAQWAAMDAHWESADNPAQLCAKLQDLNDSLVARRRSQP